MSTYYGKIFKKSLSFTAENYETNKTGKDVAVILYSGGTTSTMKGILLSNLNFNALGRQTKAASGLKKTIGEGYRILSVMPIFHGFGLGVCIHMALIFGFTCITELLKNLVGKVTRF